MKKRLLLLFALVLLALFSAAACAQQEQEPVARNIMRQCKLQSPSSKNLGWIYDNRTRYGFTSAERKGAYLQVTAPEPVYGLYIQWKETCEWILQNRVDKDWVTVAEYGQLGMAQEYVELDGLTQFRLVLKGNKRGKLCIAEMQALTAGTLPDTVHNWLPPHEKADLLVLSAHPDDEWIFMGGTIPYYAVERGMKVAVAYLTYADTVRRQELLEGLWVAGLRHYPVLGDFVDQYRTTLNGMYILWKEERCKAFVTGLVRRFQPEVIVTHDVEGEYGHGAHRVAADSMLFAYDAAADPQYTDAAGELWQAKKLYLHLWPENVLRMDWKTPMENFGGKTPLEVAREGFACHETQQGGVHDFQKRTFYFKVHDGGMLDNALYGLARTEVGPDEAKNDFMENID